MKPIYRVIASKFDAYRRCQETGNTEWEAKHREAIEKIVREYFPSGSGFDCGTSFDFDKSTPDKLVFFTEYHHMDDAGMYDGWTQHEIIVKPSLALGYDFRITGRNRNWIKDYIGDTFAYVLSEEIDPWEF